MTKTKAMMFTEIKTIIEGTELSNKAELVEFIDKQIEQLSNKSKNRKPTPAQLENEKFKAEILATLSADVGMCIKDIKTANPVLSGLENQKLSALLRQLGVNEVGTGQVEKYTEKRVTYFKLVAETDEISEETAE
jgi:hypothetical protein